MKRCPTEPVQPRTPGICELGIHNLDSGERWDSRDVPTFFWSTIVSVVGRFREIEVLVGVG